MSVTRYEPQTDDSGPMIIQHLRGNYVRYDDYARLLAAVKRIAAEKGKFGWDGDRGVCCIAEDAIAATEQEAP